VLRAGGVTTGMTLETTQRVDFRHYRCKPAEYGPMTAHVVAREKKHWAPKPAWNWHEPRSGSAPAKFERVRPARDSERATPCGPGNWDGTGIDAKPKAVPFKTPPAKAFVPLWEKKMRDGTRKWAATSYLRPLGMETTMSTSYVTWDELGKRRALGQARSPSDPDLIARQARVAQIFERNLPLEPPPARSLLENMRAGVEALKEQLAKDEARVAAMPEPAW
jgi:hypothetical protein